MAKIKSKNISKTRNKKMKKINVKGRSKEPNSILKLKSKKNENDPSENDSCSKEDNEEQGQCNEEFKLNDSINSENSENELVTDEDEAAKHKKDLVRLKQSDPEFYKYLQENDKKLLQFNLSDDEDYNTLNDEEIHKPSETLDVASDESDFEVIFNILTNYSYKILSIIRVMKMKK